MERENKPPFTGSPWSQELRISTDFPPLFHHNFLPTFKPIFSTKWIGICFSLTKCTSSQWESPVGAVALTLEGMKLAFAFWWSWPLAVCMPKGIHGTYSLIWKIFMPCSSSVWMEKSHSVRLFIPETVLYVRPLIHKCLRSGVLCNPTSCWGFTVKTLWTEKGICVDTVQTLTLFLN